MDDELNDVLEGNQAVDSALEETPVKATAGGFENDPVSTSTPTPLGITPSKAPSWPDQPAGSKANIMVAVRVRPLLPTDREGKNVVRVLDHKLVVILDPTKVRDETDVLRQNRSREKKYAFDYVFNESDDQVAVYSHTTKFMIQGVLDGFNATVFAYGQTGTGKTHTLLNVGDQPSDAGLVPRLVPRPLPRPLRRRQTPTTAR